MKTYPARVMKVLEEDGYRYVVIDGQLESLGDEPAVIYPNGTKFWYKAGKLHREGNKPAVVYPNGVQEWWHDHQRHRDGGKPALIYPDNSGVVHELRGVHEHWHRGVKTHQEMPARLRHYHEGLKRLRAAHFGEEN